MTNIYIPVNAKLNFQEEHKEPPQHAHSPGGAESKNGELQSRKEIPAENSINHSRGLLINVGSRGNSNKCTPHQQSHSVLVDGVWLERRIVHQRQQIRHRVGCYEMIALFESVQILDKSTHKHIPIA